MYSSTSTSKHININHVNVVLDIRKWLISFDHAAVEYCHRSSNSYADLLAKKGTLRKARSKVWMRCAGVISDCLLWAGLFWLPCFSWLGAVAIDAF
ncbi:hypothetical protein Q3G72_022030 [Acer saccharum]|nr:hypothetical protein Q3G72_022030 [Acer saccharum]